MARYERVRLADEALWPWEKNRVKGYTECNLEERTRRYRGGEGQNDLVESRSLTKEKWDSRDFRLLTKRWSGFFLFQGSHLSQELTA